MPRISASLAIGAVFVSGCALGWPDDQRVDTSPATTSAALASTPMAAAPGTIKIARYWNYYKSMRRGTSM